MPAPFLLCISFLKKSRLLRHCTFLSAGIHQQDVWIIARSIRKSWVTTRCMEISDQIPDNTYGKAAFLYTILVEEGKKAGRDTARDAESKKTPNKQKN